MAAVVLPEPIGSFVVAANSWNLNRLVSALADDALVNDQLEVQWGKREIEVWAARDIIGERLVMKVVHKRQHTTTLSSLRTSTETTTDGACLIRSFSLSIFLLWTG